MIRMVAVQPLSTQQLQVGKKMHDLKVHVRLYLSLCALWLGCSDAGVSQSTLSADGAVADAGIAPEMGVAAADAGQDARIKPDLGSDMGEDAGEPEMISCGTEMCEAQTEICCADALGLSMACIDAQGVCEGAVVACDGPEDCSDEYCCVVATFEADIFMRTAELEGQTECISSCNFAFDYNPVTGQGEITARACHSSIDCPATESVCCEVPGISTGMCLTESAATLAEEYTYGLMDCG